MPIYDKPVRQLMRAMVADLVPTKGTVMSRQQAVAWFKQHYPKIKESTVTCHLIQLSTNAPSRFHYLAKPGRDDVLFQMDRSHFRLYDPQNDPPPLTEAGAATAVPPPLSDESGEPDEPSGGNEFAYEHDLRDYLARNLHLIEPGLKLYEDEDVKGIEFPVGGRYVDILAVDNVGDYVVIELKVSRGYDRVVGQLLRYVAWVQKHHADPGQRVRGVIVGRQITEDLQLACHGLQNVSLFEYELSVSLKKVAAGSS
jgi:hypothetical protein